MTAQIIDFPDLMKLDYAERPGQCKIIILPVVRVDRGSQHPPEKPRKIIRAIPRGPEGEDRPKP